MYSSSERKDNTAIEHNPPCRDRIYPHIDYTPCFVQCEQTEHGTGCSTIGVCGKTPEVANMQDLLVYQLKGLSCWAHEARKLGTLLSFALSNAFLNASTGVYLVP
jgi:hypothetical protein